MEWKDPHAANAAARILVQNALFAIFGLGRRKLSSLVMASCTFTDLEVATVGMLLKEAQQKGVEVYILSVPINNRPPARMLERPHLLTPALKVRSKEASFKVLFPSLGEGFRVRANAGGLMLIERSSMVKQKDSQRFIYRKEPEK